MFVSPRSAGAWVKGEFTPYLAARRSLTNELFRLFWLESGIWMLQIKFSSASPARTSYPSLPNQLTPRTQSPPARTSYPGLPNQLTPRTQLPPPPEQATLAYPTQGFPNRTPPHNIALSKEQAILYLTKHNLPYMMSSRK